MFMPGDKVKYVGEKFRTVIGSRIGEIVTKVNPQYRGQVTYGYVVDFGDEAYILKEASLDKNVQSSSDNFIVQHIRKSHFSSEE